MILTALPNSHGQEDYLCSDNYASNTVVMQSNVMVMPADCGSVGAGTTWFTPVAWAPQSMGPVPMCSGIGYASPQMEVSTWQTSEKHGHAKIDSLFQAAEEQHTQMVPPKNDVGLKVLQPHHRQDKAADSPARIFVHGSDGVLQNVAKCSRGGDGHVEVNLLRIPDEHANGHPSMQPHPLSNAHGSQQANALPSKPRETSGTAQSPHSAISTASSQAPLKSQSADMGHVLNAKGARGPVKDTIASIFNGKNSESQKASDFRSDVKEVSLATPVKHSRPTPCESITSPSYTSAVSSTRSRNVEVRGVPTSLSTWSAPVTNCDKQKGGAPRDSAAMPDAKSGGTVRRRRPVNLRTKAAVNMEKKINELAKSLPGGQDGSSAHDGPAAFLQDDVAAPIFVARAALALVYSSIASSASSAHPADNAVRTNKVVSQPRLKRQQQDKRKPRHVVLPPPTSLPESTDPAKSSLCFAESLSRLSAFRSSLEDKLTIVLDMASTLVGKFDVNARMRLQEGPDWLPYAIVWAIFLILAVAIVVMSGHGSLSGQSVQKPSGSLNAWPRLVTPQAAEDLSVSRGEQHVSVLLRKMEVESAQSIAEAKRLVSAAASRKASSGRGARSSWDKGSAYDVEAMQSLLSGYASKTRSPKSSSRRNKKANSLTRQYTEEELHDAYQAMFARYALMEAEERDYGRAADYGAPHGAYGAYGRESGRSAHDSYEAGDYASLASYYQDMVSSYKAMDKESQLQFLARLEAFAMADYYGSSPY